MAARLLGGGLTDGRWAQDKGAHSCCQSRSGVPALLVFLNKTDVVDGRGRSLSFVETGRCGELLDSYDFPG